MKRIILSVFTCLLFLQVSAQKEIWLEFALKGGGGASFLLNKNLLNDDFINYQITSNYGFGAKFAVNFGPFHGISIEGMYNNLGQDMTYDLAGIGTDLSNEISWKSIDTYLLYRYITNRVYLELGPMYSSVSKVEQNDNGVEGDVSDNYTDSYLGGAFGFGGYIANAESFSLGIGIRATYGFQDFVSERGMGTGYPNPATGLTYDSYEKSNPAFVQFLVEFNFGLGRFAKAQCSKRMSFFRGGRR